MDAANTSKVNTPDAVPQRPVIPGNNSWAQQQQKRDREVTPVTFPPPMDQEKYENKPMPPLPLSTPPLPSFWEDRSSRFLLPARAFVPPETTRSPDSPGMSSQKTRSVTDPATPTSFMEKTKSRASQLVKKLSLSRGKERRLNDAQIGERGRPTRTYSMADSGRSTTPTPALVVPPPNLQLLAQEVPQERTATPVGLGQSSAVPTRHIGVPTTRYLMENKLPLPGSSKPFSRPQNAINTDDGELEESKITQIDKPMEGLLNSAEIRMHTNVGEGELVRDPGLHQVSSVHGMIEDAPACGGSNAQKSAGYNEIPSQLSEGQGEAPGKASLPYVDSPTQYGSVWENSSAVGETLQPYTPTRQAFSSRTDSASHYDTPFIQQPLNTNKKIDRGVTSIRSPNSQPQYTSASNMATETSRGYSYESRPENSLAQLSHDQIVNSVPSPEQVQHAALMHTNPTHPSPTMNRPLSYASLNHINHIADEILNQTLGLRQLTEGVDRRFNNSEGRLNSLEGRFNSFERRFDSFERRLISVECEVRGMSEGVRNIEAFLHILSNNAETVKGLKSQVSYLEKLVDELSQQIQYSLTSGTIREPDSGGHHRSQHRRVESAYPALGQGQGEPRERHRRGARSTSNIGGASGTSSGEPPSNASAMPQSIRKVRGHGRIGEDQLAELAAQLGPAPDIHHHPAFAEQTNEEGDDGELNPEEKAVLARLPYHPPSFADGSWYDQAFARPN